MKEKSKEKRCWKKLKSLCIFEKIIQKIMWSNLEKNLKLEKVQMKKKVLTNLK